MAPPGLNQRGNLVKVPYMTRICCECSKGTLVVDRNSNEKGSNYLSMHCFPWLWCLHCLCEEGAPPAHGVGVREGRMRVP
jgi:hypothetical protein